MATAKIHITLKPTLLDTQGATVLKALHQLGHSSVQDVRIGKLIEVQLDDTLLPAQQQAQLETMCQKLLANPVIEDFQIVLNNGENTGTSSTRSAPVITEVVTQTVSTTANSTSTSAPQISASPTNPVVPISPMAIASTPIAPLSNTQTLGSESTTIADPFAVSFDAYDAMSVDERLDLQGRAWNIHGTNLLQEMNNRRAAWLLVVGGRVLEAGETLDNYPSDERIAALGQTHDLVPFTFTMPPQ